MSVSSPSALRCTLLPVQKVIFLSVLQVTVDAVREALSKYTDIAPEAFELYVKANNTLIAWGDNTNCNDSVFALVRCRGGGKGGFRKQLEKKARGFARAKMKEKRNNAKLMPQEEGKPQQKKQDIAVVKAVLAKAEPSETRALVNQGLAFVMDSLKRRSHSC
ncbi:hypothetical protein JKF63_07903 [Porcisia hertigi]|uniref:Uncharacterized protein n=1 Tax=Porcisia hertigi TaxID=2761500 RepID=A0A836LJU5_9TRYP|nr:hypothetical protein JKF63_07903 [Porcisia hertigi]